MIDSNTPLQSRGGFLYRVFFYFRLPTYLFVLFVPPWLWELIVGTPTNKQIWLENVAEYVATFSVCALINIVGLIAGTFLSPQKCGTIVVSSRIAIESVFPVSCLLYLLSESQYAAALEIFILSGVIMVFSEGGLWLRNRKLIQHQNIK